MFKSEIDRFFVQSEADINKTLDGVGRMLKDAIVASTPVQTGNLQARNNYNVQNKVLTLYNTAEYAPFVELGTIYQTANPFMRTAIYANVSKIRSMLIEGLKE